MQLFDTFFGEFLIQETTAIRPLNDCRKKFGTPKRP
jgi:hypothetical protein